METLKEEMTDRQLLQAYVWKGDTESLGAFLGRYEESLVRFAARLLGDSDLAQDVVQETFLRVVRNPKRLLKAESFHNWLLRVTRNVGVDRIRRDARFRKHAPAIVEEAAARAKAKAERAAGALEREELKTEVRAAIDRLNPRYREILLLKVGEEKTYREIAAITGLTVTHVGFLLHRAMKELSRRLARSHARDLKEDATGCRGGSEAGGGA